jgi:hypothetical protein
MNKAASLFFVFALGLSGCGGKASPTQFPAGPPPAGLAPVLSEDARAKAELEKFAGTWAMLERNNQGAGNRKWVFTTEKITDRNGTVSREGTYTVDPAKKHLDFLVGGKVKFVGIYDFSDGDQKLKFCGAEVPAGKDKEAVRPTDLRMQTGWILYLLERQKE